VYSLYDPKRTCPGSSFERTWELDWNLILNLDHPLNFYLLYRTENRHLPPESFEIFVSLAIALARSKHKEACLFSRQLPSEL
jgi:hypothetical protein